MGTPPLNVPSLQLKLIVELFVRAMFYIRLTGAWGTRTILAPPPVKEVGEFP